MDATWRFPRSSGRLVSTLSLVLALLANVSNLFIIGGVFAGPVAFLFAALAIWRGRGWARIVAFVAALLAVGAFAISLALIDGLSHGCSDAPGCS
jgi:ABC-type polysaccharide transport system permease subunit